ncbi:putative gamma-tubulin complex component GCP4 [Aspergillus clavatus NRRL 1]|uniref:Spindle pole body component n=1 Tax=Aspergillus clavatus (strain ATCC 1007 / CBS 513.65 / DSM 816 / NCTC 3887 / NRRL 1 / QM 1276 / 107) TaxID=344612 RepID=A1C7R2_ASPCL|nr:Spc97 / Spc98 family protein [Aspergillus clavatus NRRL 1]EAW14433.1 Spc97 / Spc98 family protein [Aspergillus clavatus NRRL 1]
MCRYELLGRGLLYWQRQKSKANRDSLSRMLHEILLSLSGQPSPLFNVHSEEDIISENAFPLAPPEKALLASLSRLSKLHAGLRKHTALISSSHPSVICRAVATNISAQHLGNFQKKILDVEKAVLAEDSAYVGGYGIVPLSTIVGEFSPWTRRLEWLWEVVHFIIPEQGTGSAQGCTGAALINYLRTESQTGYVDLEEMALHMIATAETAWMRQLSTWLLYGTLPVFGKEDFFIQEDKSSDPDSSSAVTQFVMQTNLLPQFVSLQTASSILFIGKTLNHIKAKRTSSIAELSNGFSTSPVTLQGEHIKHLASLESPISASRLSNAIDSIRLSLSQSTLSKLLPLPKILEILAVLHDFLLLRRGEFATALVKNADSRLLERHRRPELFSARANTHTGLEGLVVKEGDVLSTLTQSWTELYSLQNEEDPADEALDLAKDLIRLSISGKDNGQVASSFSELSGADLTAELSDVLFDDLLFPTPTSLSVEVRAPLDLFLSTSDISVYSKIHSYLLGIRRAQIRIGDLWKHSFLRKSHPSPWGPPRSNSAFGQSKLALGRQRDNIRIRQMRPIWATGSASLFVLSEIGSFFQGEIVNGCWQHFREWIDGGISIASATNSRPGTSSSFKNKHNEDFLDEASAVDHPSYPTQRHDPETLTVAHRRYLSSLVQSLFLTDESFPSALRSLLAVIDRFIALIIRLENVQRNMDLETDEGVVDALADYPREERELWEALNDTRNEVEEGIQNVVARLRDIDDSRSGEGRKMFGLAKYPGGNSAIDRLNDASAGPHFCQYIPRKAAGVDWLLMKLDFGHANGSMGPIAPAVSEFVVMD